MSSRLDEKRSILSGMQAPEVGAVPASVREGDETVRCVNWRPVKRACIELGVQVQDGTVYWMHVQKMPRHWKSYLMQACPYGTVFTGCVFYRSPIL